jgi:glycerophosphoryl diester phosphodiesterase
VAHIYPFNKPFLVIAHRGASYDAPENTMSAFELAHRRQADMIELDVQLSKDSVPVVFHDDSLNKKSTGKGPVHSLTVKELKQLDSGSWYSSEFAGEQILLLEEVLAWAKGKILLNIEIKPESVSDQADGGVEEKVIQLVKDFQMEQQVLISSFHYLALIRLKKIEPQIFTGLLYYKKISQGYSPLELLDMYKADFFHCSRRELIHNWADQLQQSDRHFLIYTVNSPRQMRMFIKMGAYGIFSDKPGLLKDVTEEHFQQ